MKEESKAKISVVFSVIVATMLSTAIGLLTWTANAVISQGQTIAIHSSNVLDLSKRIEKLESAALLAASTPGKLESIAVRLDALAKTQDRIEEAMTKHVNIKP